MLHFCFSLKCSSFLQILSLWKGRFYLLPGIAVTTGNWRNQRKKNSEEKFNYHKKMNKLLNMPLKSPSLLAAMTTE